MIVPDEIRQWIKENLYVRVSNNRLELRLKGDPVPFAHADLPEPEPRTDDYWRPY